MERIRKHYKLSEIPDEGIPYEPMPIKPGLGGGPRHRPVVSLWDKKAGSLDELAAFMVDHGSPYSRHLITAVLSEVCSTIPKFIRDKRKGVRFGDMAIVKPCITGSTKYADDFLDPAKNRLELRITALSSFRHALGRYTPVNVMETIPNLKSVLDEHSRTHSGVISSNSLCEFSGENIYVKPYKAGEKSDGGRMYLETEEGEYVADFTVKKSNDKRIFAILDESVKLEKRPYYVVIETYCTEAKAALKPKERLLCSTRLEVDGVPD